ncbi:methyltransferase domain-containing protein [bacterium]|nr:methyltransferase domain-containing protein [bacterium]
MSHAVITKWDAEAYTRHSSAQTTWAYELLSKLKLKGHESVIDIGCGNGRNSHEIACRLPSGSVVGIDSSLSMISLARRSWQRDNLSFQTMDAAYINLDRRFDVAFSNAVLHWVEDHQAVLTGLRRHLNPNAGLLFQMGGNGNARDIVEAAESVMALDAWSGYFHEFRFPYYFYTPGDYEKWLPECGYQTLRIELIHKDMIHESIAGLKGWLMTTWFPYTDRVPEDHRDAFLDQMVQMYLAGYPLDQYGRTHVNMVRLEVEAKVL